MVTENNSQLNSFVTGMDSDSAVDKVKSTSYTYAENLRILSYPDSSNDHGSIRPIYGITQLGASLNDAVERILATPTIRNIGAIIYISTHDGKEPQLCIAKYTNKIGVDTDTDFTVGQINDLKTIFRSPLIDWPTDPKEWPVRISTTCRHESDNNVKLYMATGFNPILMVNLADEDYSNCTIDDICAYPKVLFNKPKFQEYIAGQLKPAMVAYSYQLYDKHGIASEVSPACQFIPVVNWGDSNRTNIIKAKGVRPGQKSNSGVKIKIRLDKSSEILDRIKVFRITNIENGQMPTIEVIYDFTYTLNEDGDFIFNDTGQESIDQISIEEYNSISGIHIIPQVIEAKDNILFAANIKEVQSHLKSDAFKDWDARAFSSDPSGVITLTDTADVTNIKQYKWSELETLSKSTGSVEQESFNNITDINKKFSSTGCWYDDQGYFGGKGMNVSWRFVITEIPLDTSSADKANKIGTTWNIIQHNLITFTPRVCWVTTNGLEETTMSISDEQGRIAQNWITKSLRRDELYRYGIILYDRYGNASPVKWIADIRTPRLNDAYFNTFISHYKIPGTEAKIDLAGRPLGVSFKIDNLPEDCSAYEIVRCKRSEADIATVSQGVISRPTKMHHTPDTQIVASDIYWPTGLLTTATVLNGVEFAYFRSNGYTPSTDDSVGQRTAQQACQTNVDNANVYQFISPEICYQPESMKTVLFNKEYNLEALQYIYGANGLPDGRDAVEEGDGTFFPKLWESIDYKTSWNDTYCTSNIHQYSEQPFERTFVQPSTSNLNIFVQTWPEYTPKYWQYSNLTKTTEGYSYDTCALWLMMQNVFVKSIYYKVNPMHINQYSIRYPGSNTFTNGLDVDYKDRTSTRPVQLDSDQYSFVKLYEQSNAVVTRSYIDSAPDNDTATNNYAVSGSSLTAKINDISIASNLKWDEVLKMVWNEKGTDSETVDHGRWWVEKEFENHVDSVGSHQFCNAVIQGTEGVLVDEGGSLGDDGWTYANDIIAGAGLSDTDIIQLIREHMYKDKYASVAYAVRTMFSTGGRCALLELNQNHDAVGLTLGATSIYYNAGDNNLTSTNDNAVIDCFKTFKTNTGKSLNLCVNSIAGTSLCNIRKQVTPYGGHSHNAIAASTYYSNGQYFEASSDWNAVFDGDVYISILDYTAAHKATVNLTKAMDDAQGRIKDDYRAPGIMVQYAIPVESTINCRLSYGFEFSRNSGTNGATMIQQEPANVDGLFSQTDPEYMYNTGLASESTYRVHAAFDSDNVEDFNKTVDYRCRYSNIKENDEDIDSWTKFQSSNYLDADSRYGSINELRTFNGHLAFWQQSAMGNFSVNDRAVVNDEGGSELILGSGGVLTRYDYLDTTSGMHKGEFCDVSTPASLYWFDHHNNELKASAGSSSISLSKQGSIQSILYKQASKDQTPLLFYDVKNDEVVSRVLDEGKSISYSEVNKCFPSVYTVSFDSSATFDNGVYFIKNSGGVIRIAQWDAKQDTPKTWNKVNLSTCLEYIVNKAPIATKVFDNQEIITPQDESLFTALTRVDYPYFSMNHKYTWATETDSASSTLADDITTREHNYRYSIPRSNGDELYGNRMRGKYLKCSITDYTPNTNIAVQYIITKYRTSWS